MDVVTKQETTEVIGLDGKSESNNASPLADLFSKMEAGKENGLTAKEVIEANKGQEPSKEKKAPEQAAPTPEKKAAPAKEEKKPEEPAEKDQEKKEELSPRDALKRALEEKNQKKAEDKKAAQKDDKSEASEEVTEDELKVLPMDKPKTAKRIQALLKRIDDVNSEVTKTKAEAKEKAEKLAELEKKLSEVKTVDPKVEEDVKKQLDELAMYRRRYDLEKDPEIKTKFDARVSQAEDSIVTILKARKAGPGLLDLIKEEGGFAKFSNSGRQIEIPDGDGGTRSVSASELAEAVLKALPLGDRKAIEASLFEQVQTQRERERFFKEEQEKASEFFKKREELTKKEEEERMKTMGEAAKKIEAWKGKLESSDWMKNKDIPAGASAEEKAEIAKHNEYNGQLRAMLNSAINTKDIDGMLSIFEDAVRYYDERRSSANLLKKIEKLEAEVQAKNSEISRFKKAGGSVPKSGSIAVQQEPDETRQTSKKELTLEERFAAMERGEIGRFARNEE